MTADNNTVKTVDPISLVGIELADGDLRIVEHIGGGAFSTVYRAESASKSSTYALKFMRKADPGARDFKLQCMELESHLRAHDHPGIITLHRVLEHDEHVVLVLDYISGGDLLDAIAQQPEQYRGDEHRVRRARAHDGV